MDGKSKKRLLNKDRELTKSEWDEILWGEKKKREPKLRKPIVITGRKFRFGKKFTQSEKGRNDE